MKNNGRSIPSQFVVGLIIIAIGILLLLDQMNLFNFGSILRFLPSLFIVLGLWQLVNNGFNHWVGPVITIGAATVIQLSILGVLEDGAVWRLWPLALIIIGASILMQQRGNPKGLMIADGGEKADASNQISVLAMFGGGGRQITSQAFEGGNITTIFGAAEIDLHQAQVVNRPAIINVFAMFGGVGIKASDDQLISTELTAIFGGYGDERRQRKQLTDEQPDYIIRGVVMFGGLGIEPPKGS